MSKENTRAVKESEEKREREKNNEKKGQRQR